MAVASDTARIGYTEMKHGIQAGMVILHLMRLVGERVARYLLLTGELVSRQGQSARTHQRGRSRGHLDGNRTRVGRRDRDQRTESRSHYQITTL
jgi:hypothetical protein